MTPRPPHITAPRPISPVLPPDLQHLRSHFRRLDVRVAKLAGLFKEIHEYISLLPPVPDVESTRIFRENIQEDLQYIEKDLESLRHDTQNVKTEDMVALYTAEGLPTRQAEERAKKHIDKLLEGWLDMEVQSLFLTENTPEFGTHMNMTRKLDETSVRHISWNRLSLTAQHKLLETKQLVERSYPQMASARGKVGCLFIITYFMREYDAVPREMQRRLQRISKEDKARLLASREALTIKALMEMLEEERKHLEGIVNGLIVELDNESL